MNDISSGLYPFKHIVKKRKIDCLLQNNIENKMDSKISEKKILK